MTYKLVNRRGILMRRRRRKTVAMKEVVIV